MTARKRSRIPRLDDDYSRAAAAKRIEFISEATGVRPEQIGRHSLDPGNREGGRWSRPAGPSTPTAGEPGSLASY